MGRKAAPGPPGAEPENLTAVVGANLKRLRGGRGFTLDELARRSGVSRSMLNQIELGQSAPTINVLFKIAKALDQPFSTLLDEAHSGPRIIRAEKIQTIRSRDGEFISRALFTFDSRKKGEAYELHLAPGAVRHAEAHAPGTVESLAVSRGALELGLGTEEHHLAAGDAIVFEADVAHVYRNRGRTEVVMFLIMTYRDPG